MTDDDGNRVIDLSDISSDVPKPVEREVLVKNETLDELGADGSSLHTSPHTPRTRAKQEVLGGGKRIGAETKLFSLRLRAKIHDAIAHITVQDSNELYCDKYYASYGYSIKQGVINPGLKDNMPTNQMIKEQNNAHVLGIVA